MKISIDSTGSREAAGDALRIRKEVFCGEWKLTLPSLGADDPDRQLTLVAHSASGNQPLAALTVIDTTKDEQLHARIRLTSSSGVRVARYTQLAVLRPYRGMNLPIQLILEARRRFIVPNKIGYSWLRSRNARQPCRPLRRCSASRRILRRTTERVPMSRVLSRDEISREAGARDRAAAAYIACLEGNECAQDNTTELGGTFCGLLPAASSIEAQGLNV